MKRDKLIIFTVIFTVLFSISVYAEEDKSASSAYNPMDYLLRFMRGDINDNGAVDLSDAVFLLQYLFQSGKEPTCLDSADANDDGRVDLSDSVYILNYLFLGDTKLEESFKGYSSDKTKDKLNCKQYRSSYPSIRTPQKDKNPSKKNGDEEDKGDKKNMQVEDSKTKPEITGTTENPAQASIYTYLSDSGINALEKMEGFSEKPYNDAAGHCTVGYGHKIHNGPCKGDEKSVTKNEAKDLLKKDVKKIEDQLLGDKGLIPPEIQDQLTQEQCDSIVILVYNIGVGNFKKSKAYKRLKEGDFEGFIDEAFSPDNGFNKAGGKKVQGLQNRREKERKIFVTGDYGE